MLKELWRASRQMERELQVPQVPDGQQLEQHLLNARNNE